MTPPLTFDLHSLPTLDRIVLATLDLYAQEPQLPSIDFTEFNIPLVVGSNNGYYTGRILFRHTPAYFAVESEAEEKLQQISSITDVVVVSASGEKHAPIILRTAQKYHKKTFLISSSEQSTARDLTDRSIIMPKIREPYTYNTSTYFGYMLAETPDIDLTGLRNFLTDTLEPVLEDVDWGKYTGIFIVLPDQFVLLREMIEVKFIELFGRKIARDVFTYEQMKHATTVVQDDSEVFVCFGNQTNIRYGEHQINLQVFDDTSYAAMMLVSYYVVGLIQKSLPPYFMESLVGYCERAKQHSGFNISPIVEA